MLCFHPKEIEYLLKSYSARGLGGIVGRLTLVGLIAVFGNAVWTIKAAPTVTHVVLDLLYWVAVISSKRLPCHIEIDASPPQLIQNQNYTTTLWTAVWPLRLLSGL